MKAVILAGGRGRRLDDLSQTRNKSLVEVMGKPLIEYSLDCAAATNVDEIVVVVGYRAEEIINSYGIWHRKKRLRYVIQREQEGLVHAVQCAAEALDGHDFVLLLADEILINARHQALLDEFARGNCFAICGVLPVEDGQLIRKTYTIVQDKEGTIYRLIEKPRRPINSIMGTGNCVFKNDILKYVEFTPIHHERQEKELPDLIQCSIDDGHIIKSFVICSKYVNVNTKEDLLLAERYLAASRQAVAEAAPPVGDPRQ
ncbi:MAG TPA: nucleotidyltransferase family protein [Syntrophobacteria bacterium]|nr:nucleotidyltransferase family protein [Syntrophobacteria bacterium]